MRPKSKEIAEKFRGWNSHPMKVYTLRDYTGSESTHLATDFEAAVQAHLIHYGLLGLNGDIKEVSCKELSEIKDRSTICWELFCCLAAVTDYNEDTKGAPCSLKKEV